jgi:hypothetical protein
MSALSATFLLKQMSSSLSFLWLKKSHGSEQTQDEYYKLPRLEANAWITVYNLFMDPECRKNYEINEYRKSNLLRVHFILYSNQY